MRSAVLRPDAESAAATAVLTERIRLAFEARLDEREPEAAEPRPASAWTPGRLSPYRRA